MFKQCPGDIKNKLNAIQTERVVVDGIRYYKTPNRLVPSVTTVLSYTHSHMFDEWIDKVGEERADYVKRLAAAQGGIYHDTLEKYLLNEELPIMMPNIQKIFKDIRPSLDENVLTVYATELMMYTEELRLGGTTDLFCEWKLPGCNALVDFKTTKNPKTSSDVEHHFEQLFAYKIMIQEHTDLTIDKLVIMMNPSTSNDIQIFEYDINSKEVNYRARLISSVIRYYSAKRKGKL